jgi:hypothetical protein
MTDEIKTTLDFDSALNALNEVSLSFKTTVKLPSTKTNLDFKAIDAKQQKELLSSAMDTSVYSTGFVKVFYDIMVNNAVVESSQEVVDGFLLADKAIVALSLRKQMSEEFNVVFDEQKGVTEKVKIQDVIDNFKSYVLPTPENLEVVSTNSTLKVKINPPTVKDELVYDNEVKQNKIDDIKTDEDIQKLVANAFISELSKYITTLWVNNDEVDFKELTFKQKIRVIEKLPSNLIQKILERIASWKTDLDNTLTVKKDNYSKVINIDSLLFLG